MDKAAEDLFEKFALKQHRDLEDLRAVRGYHGIEDWGGSVTCSSVARVLSGEGGLDYWPALSILTNSTLCEFCKKVRLKLHLSFYAISPI